MMGSPTTVVPATLVARMWVQAQLAAMAPCVRNLNLAMTATRTLAVLVMRLATAREVQPPVVMDNTARS